jgi:hypothetical protein
MRLPWRPSHKLEDNIKAHLTEESHYGLKYIRPSERRG